jgi:hypothetical protein
MATIDDITNVIGLEPVMWREGGQSVQGDSPPLGGNLWTRTVVGPDAVNTIASQLRPRIDAIQAFLGGTAKAHLICYYHPESCCQLPSLTPEVSQFLANLPADVSFFRAVAFQPVTSPA